MAIKISGVNVIDDGRNFSGAGGTFTGDLSVNGTLNYNITSVGVVSTSDGVIVSGGGIDAVGIVTAKNGVQVLANGIDATGIVTAKNGIHVDANGIQVSANGIDVVGIVTAKNGIQVAANGINAVGVVTAKNGIHVDANGINVVGVVTATGANIGGNIIISGNVDGRDVAADGTKLDGIETSADVTDATNVAAAGAVMESDSTTASMSFVVDEDDMSSNSATKVPTQQSVKAYVDSNTGGATFPSGGIIMWSGTTATIPSGWVLCDGQNSTPDLRDRFIVGASDSTGDTTYPGLSPTASGGSADATLVTHSHTINNHTHSFSGSDSLSLSVSGSTNYAGSHSHSLNQTTPDQINGSNDRGTNSSIFNINNSQTPTTDTEPDHQHTISGTATGTASISGNTGNPSDTGTNSQGSSATNANLPPYYALAFIMKT